MEFFADAFAWLVDASHWRGSHGIPTRLWEHVWYSGLSMVMAAAIALPIGLVSGHTGRGGVVLINVANVGRAVPTFGIVILAVVLLGIGLVPPLLALVAFAIPPIVTNTYTGVRAVDPEVREAAAGMGMTGSQILWKVEVPVALPLIMAGVRTAAVQVVATATIAAFVGLGGLGRYIINGLALRDYAQVFVGALLVAFLALVTEMALARLQAAVTPAGLAQRNAEVAADAKMMKAPV